MNSKLPAIHGHRGARGLYPENSLVAIKAGIESGCNAIEVDICVTSDDCLVIHHDPILSPLLVRDRHKNRIEPGLRVRDLSLTELKEFDIGQIAPDTDYARRFASQISVPDTRIPTLEEFIFLLENNSSDIVFNLELKSTPYDSLATPSLELYADLVVSALRRFPQIFSRIYLQSFDWRLVLKIRQCLPELKIGLLTDLQADGDPQSPIAGQPTLWTNGYDLRDFEDLPAMVKHAGGNVWSANALDISRTSVASAHDKQLEVYVWTVNSETQMKCMIDCKVDAITTDYPDRLYLLLHGKPYRETRQP